MTQHSSSTTCLGPKEIDMRLTIEINNYPRPTQWRRMLSLALSSLTLLAFAVVIGCGGNSGTSTSHPMTVTAMTPSSVYTTGGQVVFTGTNFSPQSTVTFGGVAAQKMYY